jgi:hypothetical protein
MSIEAMKQALEALENHTAIKHPQQMHYWESAVDALRQAIEQAEMVAKGTKAWADTPDNWVDDLRGDMPDHFRDATKKVVPSNYSNSHQPVAWMKVWRDGTKNFYDHEPPMFGKHETYPLYISPKTRQKNRQVAKNATTGNQEVAKSATTDNQTPECKTDPRAPHGFDRNASHSADRYVCECESWEPNNAA